MSCLPEDQTKKEKDQTTKENLVVGTARHGLFGGHGTRVAVLLHARVDGGVVVVRAIFSSRDSERQASLL